MVHKIKGGHDIPTEISFGTDDIATHISVSNTKKYPIGGDIASVHPVTVSTVHNPSHLEIQNAVTMGKTRAKQEDYGYRRSVLNL